MSQGLVIPLLEGAASTETGGMVRPFAEYDNGPIRSGVAINVAGLTSGGVAGSNTGGLVQVYGRITRGAVTHDILVMQIYGCDTVDGTAFRSTQAHWPLMYAKYTGTAAVAVSVFLTECAR